jgi:endonuclease YncB( thermonuclease family)
LKNKNIKYAQSRLRKKILLLSAFLLLCAVVFLDRTFHPYLKTPLTTSITLSSDWDKYNEKTFTVVKVVDGDTIDIDVPDKNYKDTSPVRDTHKGDGYQRPVSNGTRIRLLAIDTPETEKSPSGAMYYGKEASDFVHKIALGQKVTVLLDKLSKTRDKYGRLLAFIRFSDGRILNEELVSQGFAYADTRFPHSYYEKYIQLEKTAIAQKKGLWEKVTPDQMPQWRRKNDSNK